MEGRKEIVVLLFQHKERQKGELSGDYQISLDSVSLCLCFVPGANRGFTTPLVHVKLTGGIAISVTSGPDT